MNAIMLSTELSNVINKLVTTLHTAIESSDWDSIREIYEELSGEEAPELPKPSTESDVLQQLIKRIEGLENSNTKQPETKTKTRKRAVKKKTDSNEQKFLTSKVDKRKVNPSGENKFESMSGLDSEIDDPGYDKINDNVPPSPRTRKGFKNIDVVCSLCNKQYSIHPMFKRDNYYCDKCVSNRVR